MNKKLVVLVTRKLPQAVEDRLRRDYEPRFNQDDRLYTTDELIALAQGADILLTCHTEKLSADVIARLPASVKAIVCFSVGVDLRRSCRSQGAQHHRHEHPRCADRRHRRDRDAADAWCCEAGQRG